MSRAIMIQGAGSNVGKSMLVAGLARACLRRGLRVAPFKPQNMSNNAAVTIDGGEIGRAQALQARACGLDPVTDMNPILLKPESETGAQVIVQGQRMATVKARDYSKLKPKLLPPVLESFHRLAASHDLLLVEGAGSPAEVNLRAGDIANMGFAQAAAVPVVLIGDIDRGGVIAQLVGTHAVLSDDDNALIQGFAVNKFRGDPTLFHDGMDIVAERTRWTPLGIVPWFHDAWRLPAEDIMDLKARPGGACKIAVPRLNRIANFDDLDPLSAEPSVTVEIIETGQPLPADADLILIPGSKSTIADLAHFRSMGWHIDLAAHIRRGGAVLGICGGYQMLGREIHDPDGIEGTPQSVDGLGHLDIVTRMTPHKHLKLTKGQDLATGAPFEGYEIHIGETTGPDCLRPWLKVNDISAGASNESGRVQGCYIHGLFASDDFRAEVLRRLGAVPTQTEYGQTLEDTLDALANHLETHLDIDGILKIARDVS